MDKRHPVIQSVGTIAFVALLVVSTGCVSTNSQRERTESPQVEEPPRDVKEESKLPPESMLHLEKLFDQRAYREKDKLPEIQDLTRQLSETEKAVLYNKYSLKGAVLSSVANTFYGVGSWVQGDYLSGAICTGSMGLGVLVYLNAFLGFPEKDPRPGFIMGGGMVTIGVISGWILPIVFEASMNSKLREALEYYP
jgi:hypothetical protein